MLAREDPRVKDNLIILAESPNVPSNGLGLRQDIGTDIKLKLKRTLIEMDNNPEGKEVLEKFGVQRFIETTVKDYSPVFDIAEKAGIDLGLYEYQNE